MYLATLIQLGDVYNFCTIYRPCCKSIDMGLNARKSVAMIFTPRNSNKRLIGDFEMLKLRKDDLELVNSFKYLGHIGPNSQSSLTILTEVLSHGE